MASAGIFNLINIDDTDQDSYLIAFSELQNRLLELKKSKIQKLDNIIYELNKKINKISNLLYQTIEPITYNKLKSELDSCIVNLKYAKNNYIDLVKPKLNDVSNSHFLFINNEYKPFVEFSFEYTTVSVNSKPLFGGVAEFDIPVYGEFITDMLIYIKLSELKPVEATDKVRYAEFLGHKIIKNIQFIINNNIIDEYTSELYNIHYEYHVSESKKKSWLQCMGQEIPIEATLIQDPINDNHKERRLILNGYQTLKNTHTEVELFIPLLFWFNKDKRLAFPNIISTPGKVKIKATFEENTKLMTCLDVINDLYHEQYSIPNIQECELYTNHIFITHDIQDIFINRLGFMLIRIHKKIEYLLDKNKDRILLPELKFPIEYLYLYMRPDANETGLDNLQTWYKNSILSLKNIKTPVMYYDNLTSTYNIGYNNIKYYEETQIISSLELFINNTSIFGSNSGNFYNSYLPYINSKNIYSNTNNIYFIPFSFNDFEYQPCGYINLSKMREIYLEYTSEYIELYKPIKLYVYATTINFLLFDSNSAVLKYLS
jgi:hypothetical protein